MARRVRTALFASFIACCVTMAPATPSSASRDGAPQAQPRAGGPARLTLPAPTGPYPVGTVDLHLVDHSRPTAS
jgi:hypothetical protein